MYHDIVSINYKEFHYGPIIPGDSEFKLLPNSLKNIHSLELGCGGAQNSIFLAKQGAKCAALDISQSQLDFAAKYAKDEAVKIDLICSPMENISEDKLGSFDLIHSSYAISFSDNPKEVIKKSATMLKDKGTMLISTGHPLFSGEWIDLGDGEDGLFIKDYFNPTPDIRYDDKENETVRSTLYTLSEMTNWFLEAGLFIEKIIEPKPLKIDKIDKSLRKTLIPYSSNGWCDYYKQFSKIPGIVIFKARKFN